MKSPSRDIFRIIDASLNRIGEGLRALEEYARFSLDDTALTQQLKDLRHRLVHIDPELQVQLIRNRDSARDVGADMEVKGEVKERDTSIIITANARRVQESLRVMEELARDTDLNLDTNKYKKARFVLYTIEKELMGRMFRKDKAKRLSGLYVIIDTGFLKGRRPADVATQAIRGGAKVIQLRAKNSTVRDFLRLANEIQPVCASHNVLLIVNDSLEVALASGVDGLNVGQHDIPVADARRLLPIDKILGSSASTLDEAKAASAAGADYLGVGAIFPTATKDDATMSSFEIIREIKKTINLPIVAIGGINKNNIKKVMEAGADAAAVISAVMEADDIEKATRQLIEIIKGARGE